MGDYTVRVESLWRKFATTSRKALKYGMIDSARRMVGMRKDSEHLRPDEFWALQDVSFQLGRGEAMGIMGVNGSGKTTLLRILNGTYSPDRGKVTMRGRVGSLIAAGAGFSPMLSGRENVQINGLLLGLSPGEIRRKFDEIVDFSGLDKFIDMPVRNYSSGMTVRLGFAIAVIAVPDILLVDEVLAVGDIAFQKRCYDRMLAIRDQGTTVIVVSHSVGAIWAVCDCGLFLNKGISSGKISPEALGRAYDLENFRSAPLLPPTQDGPTLSGAEALASIATQYGGKEGGSGDAIVEKFELCDARTGAPRAEFEFGEDIGLVMEILIAKRIEQAIFRYSIDAAHYKFICNLDSCYSEGMGLQDLAPGRYTVRTRVRGQRFRPGAYGINMAVCQKTVGVHLYFRARAGQFIVRPPSDRFLYDSDSLAVVDFDAHFSFDRTQGREETPTRPLHVTTS
jgi:lipopolysaccharide transport system ATP-binding protein